ncbi:hypothetical protein SAMN04488117_10984 [Celeribacter baekdonensis]|uniref:Uncharacterized protein n=1 Tax=Celeribacter baekdonensis TaxID=875171 RepID=A0A1G7QDN6_9RHOB|nr:hypothetical protein SAMN04488117_10984 [Celeribacter baekdonensis]
MTNPFKSRAPQLSGPAQDILPVTPSDVADLPSVAIALYVETGGAVTITTVKGETRSLNLADFSILPVGVSRVHATGTDAVGIHAMVLA